MNSSVLATSSAFLTLSPIGHVVAGLVLGPGESPVVLGRLLLQDNSIAFNGERLDPVTGLYHLGQGYRAYNPGLMRFHAADSLSPFGEGGINPYAYCLGDPVSLVDPTGHISWQAGLGIGLGILGIIVAIATLGMGIKASVAMWGAAAGVSASAIASTSLGVVSSALGLVSSAFGIASSALAESDSQLAANLGWASLGVGIASLATGLAGFGLSKFTSGSHANRFPTAPHAMPTRSPPTVRLGSVEILRETRISAGGYPFNTYLRFNGVGTVNGNTLGQTISPYLAAGPIDLASGYGAFGGKFSSAQLLANQTGKVVNATKSASTWALSERFTPLTGISKYVSNTVGRGLSDAVRAGTRYGGFLHRAPLALGFFLAKL